MPQVGIHGMVGMATRKWLGAREWLLLGAMLGSFVPDMDNVGVAVATLMKMPTAGIHRAMTHSIFFLPSSSFSISSDDGRRKNAGTTLELVWD